MNSFPGEQQIYCKKQEKIIGEGYRSGKKKEGEIVCKTYLHDV
jgi:hypothetical protein